MKLWNKKDEIEEENPNTPEEKEYLAQITNDQTLAEGGVRPDTEDKWDDEYLAFKGDQWDTSIAPRDAEDKSVRPNSVSNFLLPTIMNIVDGLTTSVPSADLEGREDSDDLKADKLNDLIPFIFDRNDFSDQWKNIVLQGVKYGCFIGTVIWDSNYIGGSGPHRWIGEIRTLFQKKEEIFFDPAILDLEERLQECEFIHRKYRKKLSWIRDTWEENGKHVLPDLIRSKEYETNEGADPNQATIIERWHKGTPKFVPEYWKDRFNEIADEEEAKEEPDEYRVKKYRDMAKGELKGVHCAYSTQNIFLEYVPYVYDDGLYPFVYRVLYKDERNPYGFGELRNLLNPQIFYNKAMEIEIEAMVVEGLGGYFYSKGALSKGQLKEYRRNAFKSGVMQEVNDKDGLERRQGTQTPNSLIQLKETLKKTIDTVSQNTAIQQGISPGANVPYSSIQELGARADVRNKGKVKILERFMTSFVKLIVSRIAQFYTEEREYRIRGNKSNAIQKLVYEGIQKLVDIPDKTQRLQGMIQLIETIENADPESAAKYGIFKNEEIMKTWDREVVKGEDGTEIVKKETYIPDFDIKVKIVDERPSSRQYYESLALSLFGKGLGPKAFWETIEDGKFPPVEEILNELNELQGVQEVQQNPDIAQNARNKMIANTRQE